MSLVAVGLALAALGMVTGAVSVWYFWRRAAWPATRNEEGNRRTREILACWNDFVVHLASDIDKHGSRLREVYEELRTTNGQRPATVETTVAELIEDSARMQDRLIRTKQRLYEQTQATTARTDGLTQLAVRWAFDEEMHRCLRELQCSKTAFTLLMIDVDRFKLLNDTYGRPAGDEVLRSMAQILRTYTRASDVAARYGGEKFAIILSGTPAERAQNVAEAMRATIDGMRFSSTGTELHATASIGLSEMLQGDTVPDVVRRADAALRAAKKNGRNCVFWHDGQTVCRAASDIGRGAPGDPLHDEFLQRETTSPGPGSESTVTGLIPPHGFDGVNQTGVCSRNTFCLALGHRLAELRRTRVPLSVVLIRIDNYRKICDTHGSHAGSLALQAAAKFFTAALREMDWVARLDMTTFAALLPGAGVVNATRVAERLRTSVARASLRVDGHPLKVTISTGTAEATPEEDGNTLLCRAAAAMEIAVRAGGNQSHSDAVARQDPVSKSSLSQPLPV